MVVSNLQLMYVDHIDLGTLKVPDDVVPRVLAYRNHNISQLIAMDEISKVEYGKLKVRMCVGVMWCFLRAMQFPFFLTLMCFWWVCFVTMDQKRGLVEEADVMEAADAMPPDPLSSTATPAVSASMRKHPIFCSVSMVTDIT